MNNISIVISTRNSEQYIEKCLDSAVNQDYSKFEIIFLDANSNDKTYEKALKYKNVFSNIQIIKNETRKYQGENIRIGTELSKNKSIIVTLDGDDWFPHSKVLSRINNIYLEKDCWMTYGSYIEYPYRDVSFHYHEYPREIKENNRFRNYKWMASHLRTFRRELFLKIKEEDLKDSFTNNYFSMAPDLSFQLPMLEMCPSDKSVFINDILYVYNKENPLSEDKIDIQEQERIANLIKSKPSYNKINKLYE